MIISASISKRMFTRVWSALAQGHTQVQCISSVGLHTFVCLSADKNYFFSSCACAYIVLVHMYDMMMQAQVQEEEEIFFACLCLWLCRPIHTYFSLYLCLCLCLRGVCEPALSIFLVYIHFVVKFSGRWCVHIWKWKLWTTWP